MAARLTPGGLGWRKGANPPAPVALRLPASPALATPVPSPAPSSTDAVGGGELDHTEALERWASTAGERPLWMRDPELSDGPASPPVPAHATEGTLRAFTPTTAAASVPDVVEPAVPAFDDATDRFAQFAMRAAETQSLFSRGDDPIPPYSPQAAVQPGPSPASTAALNPGSFGTATEPGRAASNSGWRPDDVHVSAADMDADAVRLEMLAARASEARESHGDFAVPTTLPWTGTHAAADPLDPQRPAIDAPVVVSGWRRETVAVSGEEFDADAARLEMLASRAADYRPPVLEPEPVAATDPDERVSFWRKDAAVVTAEEFDADAARLESLAARGPLFSADALSADALSGDALSGVTARAGSEATPFWEQQERARREAEQVATAEASALDAAANDAWHSRWDRIAADAAWRGETPDPLGL